MTDSTISDNGLTVCDICGGFKGGAGIVNHGGSTTVTGSAITGNSGGGIYSSGLDAAADVTITDSTISGNLNGVLGGNGLSLSATVSNIQNCFINDNESRGIYSRFGNLTIDGSTISGNAGPEGSGIRNVAADLTISETTISGNTATGTAAAFTTLRAISRSLRVRSAAIRPARRAAACDSEPVRASPKRCSSAIPRFPATRRTAGAAASGCAPLPVTASTSLTAPSPGIRADFGGGGLYFFFSTGADAIDHTIVAGNVRGNGGRDDIKGDVEASFSLDRRQHRRHDHR